MAKSARKFAVLFLTLALSFSFSTTVFAAEAHDHDCETGTVCEANTIGESASPLSACQSHTWVTRSDVVRYGGNYISASVCESLWRETRRCTKCGATESARDYYISNDTHYIVKYSASCNGTTQTFLNKCNQCGHSMPTTTKRCPGAPHGGVCRYLSL